MAGRRRGTLLRLVPAAAALMALSACRFGAPPGATEEGQSISRLYQLLFYTAIPIGAVVYLLIGWVLLRYRRRNEDLPRQFRYNIPIEVIYTLVPILVVAGLFVATYDTERGIDRVSADPDVRLNVTAFQWQWRFVYPDLGVDRVGRPGTPPTIVLPVDRTVRVRLVSADVDHAFYVPAFLFKRDAIPGFPNTFDLRISEPGSYLGECAEFCGLDHANMTFLIKAVPWDAFRSWAERQAAA